MASGHDRRVNKIDDKMHWCNRQLVLDLLLAVENGREPACSGEDARWSLEMIMGVYAAHFERGRVELPLKDRRHPLGEG